MYVNALWRRVKVIADRIFSFLRQCSKTKRTRLGAETP